MNTIKELLDKYCPGGVEYKKLGEVCTVLRGKRLIKKELSGGGPFPVFHGGIEPIGYYSKGNRQAESVMIIDVGASAGTVGYCKNEFWSSDGCFCLSHVSTLEQRYLFFLLQSLERNLKSKVRRAGIPTLDNKVLENLLIPVPPLPVQREIVRILDSFTSLEAELEAELEARRKQYEYYRDQLLSFKHLSGGGKNEVEWKTLGEVATKISSGRNKEKLPEGMFPVYGSTGIIAYSNSYQFDRELILVARVGANAGFVNIANGKYDVSDNTLIIEPNENTSLKYLFYVLQNMNINQFAKGGGQPLITARLIKDLRIPIPPLSTQRRIVSILDRFESLVNDITTGLPAEITARHQQYEYYRDQLLSFKRKS